jgi:hypothetical protein
LASRTDGLIFGTIRAYLKSLVNNRAVGGTKSPPQPNTLQEYARSIDSFIFVLGDLRIGSIDKEVVGDYFSVLRLLPPNLNKSPRYRGKSISEVLALGDPPINQSTASKKIERISFMFKWALIASAHTASGTCFCCKGR